MRNTGLLAAMAALCAASPALAADAVSPGRLELYPTWSAVGLEVAYSGDDNRNSRCSFVWRVKGAEEWRNGVDMTYDRKRRLVWASIWPFDEGTAVEVKVTFSDADTGDLPPLPGETRTKKMLLEPAGGRRLVVSPGSSDSNTGTADAPYRTLARAAKAAKPGDVILAMSGVYPEGSLFGGLKGAPGRPIVIMAAPGEKPVLDSSIGIKKGSGAWKKSDGAVYVASVDFKRGYAGYVAQDGKRSFRYKSLRDLKAAALGPKRAWWYDQPAKKLYVTTGDGGDPNEHEYRVGRHNYGIWLTGSRNVVVRGFEIRNYGDACVRLGDDARGCILIDNVIHGSAWGVFLKGDGVRDNAVWRNLIYEEGLHDFAWGAIKKSGYPRQGIAGTGGRGNSYCYNRVIDWFDLIVISSWQQVERIDRNRDTDIMFNDLWDAGDDALEPDGGGVNYRMHGNRIRNCWTAISLAPIERGPFYVTRNDATFKTMMFKFNVGNSVSLGWTFCYHNSAYCLLREGTGTGVRFAPDIPTGNKVLKNNAFVSAEWSIGNWRKGCEFDHNCYFNVPSKPIRRFNTAKSGTFDTIEAFRKATGQEKNGIYANPKFRTPIGLGVSLPKNYTPSYDGDYSFTRAAAAVDLAPKPDSPCIDRGAVIRGINDGFKGRAPDIGAFELGAERAEFTTGPGGGPGKNAVAPPASAEAKRTRGAKEQEGPSAEAKAAAAKAFAKLKAEIIKGASEGRRARVYVDMAGKQTRARVLGADGDGVNVSARGLEVTIKWSAFAPTRFYGIARKYSQDHASLYEYCVGSGLEEEAEREKARR